jgi:hypothetical protein
VAVFLGDASGRITVNKMPGLQGLLGKRFTGTVTLTGTTPDTSVRWMDATGNLGSVSLENLVTVHWPEFKAKAEENGTGIQFMVSYEAADGTANAVLLSNVKPSKNASGDIVLTGTLSPDPEIDDNGVDEWDILGGEYKDAYENFRKAFNIEKGQVKTFTPVDLAFDKAIAVAHTYSPTSFVQDGWYAREHAQAPESAPGTTPPAPPVPPSPDKAISPEAEWALSQQGDGAAGSSAQTETGSAPSAEHVAANLPVSKILPFGESFVVARGAVKDASGKAVGGEVEMWSATPAESCQTDGSTTCVTLRETGSSEATEIVPFSRPLMDAKGNQIPNTFIGSISGNTLTVKSLGRGSTVYVGMEVSGPGIETGTVITGFVPKTETATDGTQTQTATNASTDGGGTGDYRVSVSQNVGEAQFSQPIAALSTGFVAGFADGSVEVWTPGPGTSSIGTQASGWVQLRAPQSAAGATVTALVPFQDGFVMGTEGGAVLQWSYPENRVADLQAGLMPNIWQDHWTTLSPGLGHPVTSIVALEEGGLVVGLGGTGGIMRWDPQSPVPAYTAVTGNALDIPTVTLTSDWTKCADEGQACTFVGPTEVRYGANGQFSYPAIDPATGRPALVKSVTFDNTTPLFPGSSMSTNSDASPELTVMSGNWIGGIVPIQAVQQVPATVMYGPWIGTDTPVQAVRQLAPKIMYGSAMSGTEWPVQAVRKLTTGEDVSMVEDGGYTKMVLPSGEARYYVGTIADFDPAKWSTYSQAGPGGYVLRAAQTVSLMNDGTYTKMVSSTGESKYYASNTIADFDAAKWSTYSATAPSAYMVKTDPGGATVEVGMVEDDGITKMVTSTGEAKYYVGAIADFDPAKWSTYSDATGNFGLKGAAFGDPIPGVVKAGEYKSVWQAPGPDSPAGYEVQKAFDGDPTTKYVNYGGAGSGAVIELAHPMNVTGIQLTTANDAPGLDPVAYQLEGSHDGRNWSPISSGALQAPDERFAAYPDIEITSTPYLHGAWIGTHVSVQAVKDLDAAEKVYLIQDSQYTKMVSASGEARYYAGTIADFDAAKWSSYSSAGGNYLLDFDRPTFQFYKLTFTETRGAAEWMQIGEIALKGRDTLASGETMVRGDWLTSPSGEYSLTLQDDGNLVMYDENQSAINGQASWASGTAGQGVDRAEMQENGSLVLYAGDTQKWSSFGTKAFTPVAGTALPVQTTTVKVADENQSVTFSEPTNVSYGANASFVHVDGVTGTVTFNNASFGDPISGVAKAGYKEVATQSPAGEGVENAFDGNPGTKYLNLGGAGAGVIAKLGEPITLSGLRLTTANDTPDRDPVAYELYGSIDGTTWNFMSAGDLVAPQERLTAYPDITVPSVTYMNGNWIGRDVAVQAVREVERESVKLIEDGAYTKMVSSLGDAKYYVGKITDFDAAKWSSYSDAAGNYVLKESQDQASYQYYKLIFTETRAPGNVVQIAEVTPLRVGEDQHAGAKLVLQDDRNLVLYGPDGKAYWATGTYTGTHGDTLAVEQSLVRGQSLISNNGAYSLTLQQDGDLALELFKGMQGSTVLWNSNTAGKGVDRAVMQSDTNFMLYAGSTPVWGTATHNEASGQSPVLVVQDDGNVVVYNTDGAEWASGTAQSWQVDGQYDDLTGVLKAPSTVPTGRWITILDDRWGVAVKDMVAYSGGTLCPKGCDGVAIGFENNGIHYYDGTTTGGTNEIVAQHLQALGGANGGFFGPVSAGYSLSTMTPYGNDGLIIGLGKPAAEAKNHTTASGLWYYPGKDAPTPAGYSDWIQLKGNGDQWGGLGWADPVESVVPYSNVTYDANSNPVGTQNGVYVALDSGAVWKWNGSYGVGMGPALPSGSGAANSGLKFRTADAGYEQVVTGEGQSKTFTEPTNAAYGLPGKLLYKYGQTGRVGFDPATFGGDPAVYQTKNGYACPVNACSDPASPTSTWTQIHNSVWNGVQHNPIETMAPYTVLTTNEDTGEMTSTQSIILGSEDGGIYLWDGKTIEYDDPATCSFDSGGAVCDTHAGFTVLSVPAPPINNDPVPTTPGGILRNTYTLAGTPDPEGRSALERGVEFLKSLAGCGPESSTCEGPNLIATQTGVMDGAPGRFGTAGAIGGPDDPIFGQAALQPRCSGQTGRRSCDNGTLDVIALYSASEPVLKTVTVPGTDSSIALSFDVNTIAYGYSFSPNGIINKFIPGKWSVAMVVAIEAGPHVKMNLADGGTINTPTYDLFSLSQWYPTPFGVFTFDEGVKADLQVALQSNGEAAVSPEAHAYVVPGMLWTYNTVADPKGMNFGFTAYTDVYETFSELDGIDITPTVTPYVTAGYGLSLPNRIPIIGGWSLFDLSLGYENPIATTFGVSKQEGTHIIMDAEGYITTHAGILDGLTQALSWTNKYKVYDITKAFCLSDDKTKKAACQAANK